MRVVAALRIGAIALAVAVGAIGLASDTPEAVAQTSELCGDSGEVSFSDVSEGDYAADYIRCMQALGLSQGLGDGSYGSLLELTRGQMASFMVRLWRDVLGRDCPSGGEPFEDVQSGSAHAANIACIYNLGITKGVTTTAYAPEATLTASQISRFMLRLYERTDRSCPDQEDELSEAVSCLSALNVLPSPNEGAGTEAVTRDRMAVYVVGLWHNVAEQGAPPPPPAYPVQNQVPTSTSPTTTSDSGEALGGSEVLQVLAGLTVISEHRTGYQRSLFRHWSDLDRDGCDTRREILMRDAQSQESSDGSCGSNEGKWYSLYDDTWVESARSLDIDHLVPLAEAWYSGAYAWNADDREAFANDVNALVAVTASSNRSKSASDPAEWMPSNKEARCPYASAWVAIKARWRLSVDQREATFLTQLFQGECRTSGINLGMPVLAFPTIGSPTLGTLTLGETTTTTTLVPGAVPPDPGDSKNCSDFSTQSEAQAWFDRYFPHYGDVARLDGNKDGEACESLPPGSSTTTTTAITTTTTTVAVVTTTTAPNQDIPSNPGDSKNCSDFSTQSEAQAWFDRYFLHYGDVARLDGNKDGEACESLPPGSSTTTTSLTTTTTTIRTTTTAPTTTTAITTTTTTTRPVVTTTTTTRPNQDIPSNPGDSKNCSDFSTQSQAQAWFDRYFPHYGDVARLDGNKDGEACESLPRGSSTTTIRTTTTAPTTTTAITTTTTTTRPVVTTTTTTRPKPRIPPNPGNSKNCSDFSTQSQAQAWFDRYFPHYGDVARLDNDGDGEACEGLP